jgi:hypothetical protein
LSKLLFVILFLSHVCRSISTANSADCWLLVQDILRNSWPFAVGVGQLAQQSGPRDIQCLNTRKHALDRELAHPVKARGVLGRSGLGDEAGDREEDLIHRHKGGPETEGADAAHGDFSHGEACEVVVNVSSSSDDH